MKDARVAAPAPGTVRVWKFSRGVQAAGRGPHDPRLAPGLPGPWGRPRPAGRPESPPIPSFLFSGPPLLSL